MGCEEGSLEEGDSHMETPENIEVCSSSRPYLEWRSDFARFASYVETAFA